MKHIVEHINSIVSVLLGIVAILFVKQILLLTWLLIGFALASILLSIIEFLKQLFTESGIWKILSLIACIYSIAFSVIVLNSAGFSYVSNFNLAFTEIMIIILATIEVAQGLLWYVVNLAER